MFLGGDSYGDSYIEGVVGLGEDKILVSLPGFTVNMNNTEYSLSLSGSTLDVT